MATYEKKLIQCGNAKGFIRRSKDTGKLFSLVICGTELESIAEGDIDWSDYLNLKSLTLYMNKLTVLPRQLLQFRETITLVCIQNNQFREFPSILFSFIKMEHLNMHGNCLSIIPRKFCNFTRLERVYLGDNDLTSLPDIFDVIPNLKEASFTANYLTRLPPTFSKLDKLENLDISNNAIIKFPRPLLQLRSLKYLNIKRNKIQRFSPTQGEDPEAYKSTRDFFSRLVHIEIKGNPIGEHALLKDKKGITKLLKEEKVFRDLSETVPTQSLRVIVLGESGAGKTSVVEAFTLQKHVIPETTVYDHRHTVGINRYYFPMQIGDKTVLLHIWDHAGDDQYAMMNDLFITDNSLVWLVVNLKKYEPRHENGDYNIYQTHIGKWLLNVMLHDLKPTVWIICTHAESCHDIDLVKAHICHWTKRLCKMHKFESPADVPEFFSKDLDIIELDNTYDFKGHEKLKKMLEGLSSDPDSRPGFSWVHAMDRLHEYAEKESKLPIIIKDSEEYKRLNLPGNSFLKYYHDIGEIYLLESPRIVILNLDWMINLLKEIYHHKFHDEIMKAKRIHSAESEGNAVNREYIFDNAVDNREKYGKISESILKILWKCTTNNELFSSIIELFIKFNLSYCVQPDEGQTEPSYFFPHLKQEKFSEVCDYSSCRHITVTCTFSYRIPPFFLQRLALKFWRDQESVIHERLLFENGFKTEFDSGVKLYMTRTEDQESICADEMKLVVFCDSHSQSMSQSFETLWSMIVQVLECQHLILSSYWKMCGQNQLYVVCPNCVTNPSPSQSSNYIRLVGFAEKDFFPNYSLKQLYCRTCSKNISICCLVPPPTLNCDLQCYNCVKNEQEFSKLLHGQWKIQKISSSIQESRTDVFPQLQTVPADSNSSLSYEASEFEFPCQACTNSTQ